MIGESLKTTLEQMEPSQIVKIGAGNGFYYIGSVADYILNINSYDAPNFRRLEEYKIRLESGKRKLAALDRRSAMYAADPDSKEAKKFRMDRRSTKASISLTEKAIQSASKPFSGRRVLDIYESCMVYDEGTTCVIVDGTEHGYFWTIDETKKLPAYGYRM